MSDDDDLGQDDILTEEMLWERIPEVTGIDRANTFYELSARIYARGQYDEALALAETARDIYADLDTIPKRHANGWVHEGFRREARKLLPMVINYIRHNPNRKIWLTGHSLGAAMALYITQELEFAGYAPEMLFTYGCPRLGNKEYVDCIKTKHHRFVNCNDIVPTVPPSLIGFCHHGILHYINYYGNIRQLTSWQKFKDKMRAHYYAFKKGELFEGIDDHSISLYATRIKDIDPNK